MQQGKKQYWLSFLLRTLGLGISLAGVLLARPFSGSSAFLFYLSFPAVLYFASITTLTVTRLSVFLTMGKLQNKRKHYFVVEFVGSLFPFCVAIYALLSLTCYIGFVRASSVGFLFLGILLPLLSLADFVFFSPHESLTVKKCLATFAFPLLICICHILTFRSPVWQSLIVLTFVGIFTAVLFFANEKLFDIFGQKKIAYPLLWDKMPIDISSSFGGIESAGSHGFVRAEGENLIFDDGTPVRFWGVNFNSAANFPSHSYSENVARRLSQVGVNLVRLHQLDAEWSAPNIFSFTKGNRQKDSRHFDEESLERLDYLIYCLKNRGIYIYLDFNTYRRFRIEDGVENAHLLPEGGKPYCIFDEKLIALQKEYNRNLLCHVNRYTNIAYKDEPCIALGGILNECDLLDATYTKITVEPYRTQLLNRYLAYAEEKGVKNPNTDFQKRTDPFLREFLLSVQQRYVEEIIGDIRKTGAKFLLTAMNRESDRTVLYTNSLTDFSDSHAYWRGGDQRGFMNDPLVLQNSNVLTRQLVTNVIDGKPFFVSEWDAPWPNEYRADATLEVAAIGSLQNWAGFALHTYRYSTVEQADITQKLGRSIALGGSYYRGLFDCYNDPAKIGLFYHAALLFRRGDVSPSSEKETVCVPYKDLLSCQKEMCLKTEYRPRMEEARKVSFSMEKGQKEFSAVPEKVVSDTKELYRDYKKGIGTIDSPRTQAVYGFCHGKTILRDLTCTVQNDFATVALSSLTDAPISSSDSLLLTTVGRADNGGGQYRFWHTVLKKEGVAPVLCDVIEGKISIRTAFADLKVWAVNYEGQLIGQLKPSYRDGVMTFDIGKEFPSVFYLVQRQ